MEHHPETDPGVGSSDNMNLEDMTIQDLVSVLRTAFLTEDFDSVEEVLVNRDKKLQTDILRLQEMVDLEKLTRLQAEEDLRNREQLCEKGKRAQNNYEKLLKQVKKNTNLADRDNNQELREKKNELELEVCELRKLKEKWVDDRSALAQLRVRVDVLENDNNALRLKNSELENDKIAFGLKNSELEKSMEKNIEALSDDVIADSEDSDEESDGDYEPPSKRSKNAQGASSTGVKNINVVVPPTNVQKQIVTQNKPKRKISATNATSNSFDSFRFISLVHQERYSKFLTNKEFWLEKNFQLEWDKFSDIQGMTVSRGWVKLTSFANEASKTLAKEFLANAYQDPAKENGNNENDLIQYTSFVRGKKVPFDGKTINQLLGLQNYEHCSFEARVAKGSTIYGEEASSTLYMPVINWVRNEDGTLRYILSSNLTPIAFAWIQFIYNTLIPCSNVSVLRGNKLALLLAIIRGEPVNVGRLLANHLRFTANSSSPTSYINHASLISKLCERVGVYPNKNEEMVKPLWPITAKCIEKYSISVDPHRQC
ncbi:uncharacterized protein LOC131615702 [Vicia villosa]|uniref:uncharacterized protein LOC131615702 n=1 Tax=Vicia villosa TaxID=3911 RepID=UPI00273C1DF4|nr:uncharacterized protein LOC131615702 [Vicia villosa]